MPAAIITSPQKWEPGRFVEQADDAEYHQGHGPELAHDRAHVGPTEVVGEQGDAEGGDQRADDHGVKGTTGAGLVRGVCHEVFRAAETLVRSSGAGSAGGRDPNLRCRERYEPHGGLTRVCRPIAAGCR